MEDDFSLTPQITENISKTENSIFAFLAYNIIFRVQTVV